MFTLDQLCMSKCDREDVVSVYTRIDELIGDAHRAQWDDGFCREVELYGSMELFAELYCAAADLWRGMGTGMSREEAIVIAEQAFSGIHYFYIDKRIYFPERFKA